MEQNKYEKALRDVAIKLAGMSYKLKGEAEDINSIIDCICDTLENDDLREVAYGLWRPEETNADT